VIPPEHDGEYVARMEDLLAVYRQPHDPAVPQQVLSPPSTKKEGRSRPSSDAFLVLFDAVITNGYDKPTLPRDGYSPRVITRDGMTDV